MKVQLKNPVNTARITIAAILLFLVMSGIVQGEIAITTLLIAFGLSLVVWIKKTDISVKEDSKKKAKNIPPNLIPFERISV